MRASEQIVTSAPYAHEIDLRFCNPGREFSLLVVCPFRGNFPRQNLELSG